MATPGGQISAADMRNEFGATNSSGHVALGSYRVNQDISDLGELPLDDGIPQSGAISFNNMRSKQLNVVVDYYSGGTVYRQNARDKYNNQQVNYVGGFYNNTHTSPPNNGEATKVIIHVNKDIGSNKDSQNHVALKTGTWAGDTNLRVDVGGEGRIFGAGGNGGAGAAGDSNGFAGTHGTSALGVQHDCTVNIMSGGYIQAGYGGGGGGGGGYDTDKWDDELGSGGGGGGGAGLPVGNGGPGGDGWKADGQSGSNGGHTTGGAFGEGGNADNEAIGGDGGVGGQPGEDANDGGGGVGDRGTGSGGAGGDDGVAVRRTSGSITVHYTGETDRIKGATNVTGAIS